MRPKVVPGTYGPDARASIVLTEPLPTTPCGTRDAFRSTPRRPHVLGSPWPRRSRLVDVRIRTLDPRPPVRLGGRDRGRRDRRDRRRRRGPCRVRRRTTTCCPARAGTSPPASSTATSTCSWARRWRAAINFDRVAALDAGARRCCAPSASGSVPDAWLTGYAFEYAALEGRGLPPRLIDEAAGPGPDARSTPSTCTPRFANAEALRIAGVTGSRHFDDGSFIVVDGAGRPTGELREMAAIQTVWECRAGRSRPAARLVRRGDPGPERRRHHGDPPDGRRAARRSTPSRRSRPPARSTCGSVSTPGSTRATTRRRWRTSCPARPAPVRRWTADGGEVHGRRRDRHRHRLARGARHPW